MMRSDPFWAVTLDDPKNTRPGSAPASAPSCRTQSHSHSPGSHRRPWGPAPGERQRPPAIVKVTVYERVRRVARSVRDCGCDSAAGCPRTVSASINSISEAFAQVLVDAPEAPVARMASASINSPLCFSSKGTGGPRPRSPSNVMMRAGFREAGALKQHVTGSFHARTLARGGRFGNRVDGCVDCARTVLLLT